MRAGCQPQFSPELLVLILHDNLDFIRDLSKQLLLRRVPCRSLCQSDVDKLSDGIGQATMLVIDIDVTERHLRLLYRLLRSRAIEGSILFVNAKRYEKGNWAKINTCCEMIHLKDRLSNASRQD